MSHSLGLDEEIFTPDIITPIIKLLFIACKTIALKWLCPGPPTHEEWRLQVNNALLKE